MVPDYERIGRFIYSFHRICGSVETLTETALAESAPRELKVRAASLAQKFNHILENAASTVDSEFSATLKEASEIQMEIEKWRSV